MTDTVTESTQTETVVTEPLKNEAPQPTTPTKEENQTIMRLAQEKKELENKLKAKEDAEAAAKAKELEEQNKYKDLYEQEKAKREQVESEKEETERQAAIKARSNELFKDYPDAVKELADETGLTLADTDEETVEAFKEKLERISKKVNNQKVTPNNPGNPTPKVETTSQDIHEIMRDPKKFEEYIKKNSKGMAAMTKQAE